MCTYFKKEEVKHFQSSNFVAHYKKHHLIIARNSKTEATLTKSKLIFYKARYIRLYISLYINLIF